MEQLPLYVYILFGFTVFLGIWLFLRAAHYPIVFQIALSIWIIIQSVLGYKGFYSNPATMTQRFPMLFAIPLFVLLSMFITTKGKTFIDGLDLKALTLVHIVRIPVEIVLFWLCVHEFIPRAMTFEGRNFDILSGLSAPFIYYFGFVKKTISKTWLLVWNVVCIALLLNVVINAVLSLPARFLQFGFDRPNIGLGYFPFMLLPACLVPLVLFANIAAIRQLEEKKTIPMKLKKN